MKTAPKTALLFSLLLSVLLSACGKPTEKIKPLYSAENIGDDIKDVDFTYESKIAATTIEPGASVKYTRSHLDWLPLEGLIELPLDIGTAILPPLPSISRPELPKDGAWTDPNVLRTLKTIKLSGGYIRIIPIAERGPNYKPDACLFFFKCPDETIDGFLSELRVSITFKTLKNIQIPGEEKFENEHELLLAWATIKDNYNKETKVLTFNTTDENLRPYLDRYESFDIQIAAKGKWPQSTAYIDGKMFLNLKLKLASDSPAQ